MENGCGRRVAFQRPYDAILGSVCRDARRGAGKGERNGGLAGGRRGKFGIGHGEGLQRIVGCAIVKRTVEKRGRSPNAAGKCAGNDLIDIAVRGTGGEFSQAGGVCNIDVAIFACAHSQLHGCAAGIGLGGQQNLATGAEVFVFAGFADGVIGFKIVSHRQRPRGRELDHGISEIGLRRKPAGIQRGVECPVGVEEVEVSRAVGSKPIAAHPNGTLAAVGREIQHLGLLQRGLAEAHDPPRVGQAIAMRRPGSVNGTVGEEQSRAFRIIAGREDNIAAGRAVARAGIGCSNFGRRAERRAGGEIESMQALVIRAARVLRHGNDEDRSIRALLAIDHRRGCDADLRRDLRAGVVVAGGFAGGEDRSMPDLRAGVGVERINAVALCCDVENVAHRTASGEAPEVKRLGIDVAIDGVKGYFSKLG